MRLERTGWRAGDLVPLVERQRYLQALRLVVVLVVQGFAVAGLLAGVGRYELGVSTAAYLAVCFTATGLWQLLGRRSRALVSMLVLVDGAYLSWVWYATGMAVSPLGALFLLHVVSVTLLASYRTGLKVAIWDSLLALFLVNTVDTGLLPPASGVAAGRAVSVPSIAGLVAVLWLAAVATATFSAVNERELRRRRFDLEALARLATALETAADPVAVTDVFLDSLADTFGVRRALVMGIPGEQMVLMGHRGRIAPLSRQPVLSEDSVLVAARMRRVTVLTSQLDPADDEWLCAALPGARNLIVVPLSAEGRCAGVVVIEHSMTRGSRVERRVVATVERFAAHTALSLRNAWLLQQVQQMAATDGLTTIANRRTFDAALDRELSRASRSGQPLSLVLLDIDHFKGVNDRYGHQAGDDVLRTVAAALVAQCRDFDTAARYGGEEFAVILPSCDQVEALAIAERLRHAVAMACTVPVTASFGVATRPVHAVDAAALVAAADAALYRSKSSGRNCTTLASVDATPSRRVRRLARSAG